MTQVTNRRTHSNCATTQNGVADHQIWRRNAHSTECAVSALMSAEQPNIMPVMDA